jgi:phosphatidylserine/phosphatidylglycerophosphate/cardiolipin synthase-like enzyme
LNDELNVAVVDAGLTARFVAQFERDLERSRRLDPATWRQRPWLQKVRERFWVGFGEVF